MKQAWFIPGWLLITSITGLLAQTAAAAPFMPAGQYELALVHQNQRIVVEDCLSPADTATWQQFVLAMESEPQQCHVTPVRAAAAGQTAWQVSCQTAQGPITGRGVLTRSQQGQQFQTTMIRTRGQQQQVTLIEGRLLPTLKACYR